MALLKTYEAGEIEPVSTTADRARIAAQLDELGVRLEQVYLPGVVPDLDAAQDEIIESCRQQVNGLMQDHAFSGIDALTLHADTPDLDRIRLNCLREHCHSADEGRLILAGQALFCLRGHAGSVYALFCSPGDFILLPADIPHWFDPGRAPRLCAVRFFGEGSQYRPVDADGPELKRPPGLDDARGRAAMPVSGLRRGRAAGRVPTAPR